MNKNELIDAMTAKTGASKAETSRAVSALIEVISDALKMGESISLTGFGTFEMRNRRRVSAVILRPVKNSRLPRQRFRHLSPALP